MNTIELLKKYNDLARKANCTIDISLLGKHENIVVTVVNIETKCILRRRISLDEIMLAHFNPLDVILADMLNEMGTEHQEAKE